MPQISNTPKKCIAKRIPQAKALRAVLFVEMVHHLPQIAKDPLQYSLKVKDCLSTGGPSSRLEKKPTINS